VHDVTLLGHALWAIFALLALWHFVMAALPSGSSSGAVPSVDGKALFKPSRASTAAVGVLLLLFAVLLAATAGIVPTDVNRSVLAALSYVLAAGLLARGIGEFKYLGLFKRVRGSRFATLDTLVYSPLCLLLAIAVATLARRA
jgi:hypothetical protein